MPKFNPGERLYSGYEFARDSVMWAIGIAAFATAIDLVAVDNGWLYNQAQGWHFSGDKLVDNAGAFIEKNASWKAATFALLLGAFAEGSTHTKGHGQAAPAHH